MVDATPPFSAPTYAGFDSFVPDRGVRFFCRTVLICPDTGTVVSIDQGVFHMAMQHRAWTFAHQPPEGFA